MENCMSGRWAIILPIFIIVGVRFKQKKTQGKTFLPVLVMQLVSGDTSTPLP